MPIAGFRDIHGVPVKLADIDPIRDCARFNCSPASLAMLIDSARGREGIEFSASMLSKTPRQLLLEAGDYYPTTGSMMSAHNGTIRHQQMNVARDGLIVERRFTSKRNPRLSGQIDHAAIVDLTHDGTLIVDLYDLKTIKWFSVTLCAKDIWKNHPDYGWQLNLCAALMEECGDERARGFAGDAFDCTCDLFRDHQPSCAWSKPFRIRVRNLYLECTPPDASYKNEDEVRRLGLIEYQKVIIPVERKSAEETYAVYEKALALRDKTIADGYAPICADRWGNRTIQDLRCRHYCGCKAECMAFSEARGEAHPLIPTTADKFNAATAAIEATA